MVEGRVNRIDSNGVDSKLREERQVTRACTAVCQRVNETGGFKERIVRVVGDCACKYGRSGSVLRAKHEVCQAQRTLLLVCNTLNQETVPVSGIEVSARSCNLLDGCDTGENSGHDGDGSHGWRGKAHGSDELSASGGMLGPGMGGRRRV